MVGANTPAWLDGLLDFVFPPLCLGCGRYTEDSSSVCPECFRQIEPWEHPFCLNCMDPVVNGWVCPGCTDKTVPLFVYGSYTSPLEEIIIQFKFKGITKPSSLFAGLICDRFESALASLKATALVPVPLHPGRENVRGYNQAEIFARALSERLKLEVRSELIVRTKKRRPQARLNVHQRAVNIQGVFDLRRAAGSAERLILVDDVVTSGATVREATAVLEGGGYRVAGVIAIAHAL